LKDGLLGFFEKGHPNNNNKKMNKTKNNKMSGNAESVPDPKIVSSTADW